MTQISVVRQLVWKDVQLFRTSILGTMAAGGAGLAALLLRREVVSIVGTIVFFIALILAGAMLPSASILNERKKQTLPFIMSLPISPMQYTTAKLVSTLAMFAIPWLTLTAAALWLILVQGVLRPGTIPVMLILVLFQPLCMCVFTAMTLVGETEGWNVAANIICNSSHGMVWLAITLTPSLITHVAEPKPVWNSTVFTALGWELALIVLTLAITYFLQSRKRDFI
jgi:ABC-2 type transport system permease protein